VLVTLTSTLYVFSSNLKSDLIVNFCEVAIFIGLNALRIRIANVREPIHLPACTFLKLNYCLFGNVLTHSYESRKMCFKYDATLVLSLGFMYLLGNDYYFD